MTHSTNASMKTALAALVAGAFSLWVIASVAQESDTESFVDLFSQLEGFHELMEDFEDEEEERAESEAEFASYREFSNKKLIKKLKRDPYPGYNPAAAVFVERGASIVPVLLKELGSSKDYYRNKLLEILSDIDTPETTNAFIAELNTVFEPGEKDFIIDNNLNLAVTTLGERQIKDAVPILNKILDIVSKPREAEENQHLVPGLQSAARIALNRIGEPRLLDVPDDRVTFEDSLELHGTKELALVVALLKNSLVDYRLHITSIEQNALGNTVVKGEIPDAGNWDLEISLTKNGMIPVYYEWFTGGLSAGGHVGVFEEKNGHWLVTQWHMLWIS